MAKTSCCPYGHLVMCDSCLLSEIQNVSHFKIYWVRPWYLNINFYYTFGDLVAHAMNTCLPHVTQAKMILEP